MSLTKNTVLIGTLAAAILATQIAAAAEGSCLQRNRLSSWRAVDDRTLEMTDRQMNRYTVRLMNRCLQATRAGARLSYRHWTALSCLRSGEILTVSAPGGGRATCSIAGVEGAQATPTAAN